MPPRRNPPPSLPPSPPPPPDVVIDGSLGEGGGQIVRLSLSLSAILSRSVLVTNIRSGRASPGLQAQHVAAAELVSAVANAPLSDARPGATQTLQGVPRDRDELPVLPVQTAANTAAATALMLQAGLPAALRFLPGGGEHPMLALLGGTTALFAPPSDYVRRVLVPNLRQFGVDMKYDVVKDGFYPRGGGSVAVSVDKAACEAVEGKEGYCTLNACELTQQGAVLALQGDLLVCGHEYVAAGVVEAMLHAATERVRLVVRGEEAAAPFRRKHINVTDVSRDNTSGKCLCLTLYARTSRGTVLGASALWSEKEAGKHPEWGKAPRGRRTYKEKVKFWRATAAAAAGEAVKELCEALQSEAAVDAHMADQLIVFMAMAKGTSRLKVPKPTMHLQSVVQVCQAFGVDVKFEGDTEADSCVVVCEGNGVELVR